MAQITANELFSVCSTSELNSGTVVVALQDSYPTGEKPLMSLNL